jgi:hypothetical protein
VRAALGLLLLCLGTWGCTKGAPSPAAPAARCQQGLAKDARAVEGHDPSRRLRPVLGSLAAHCEEALGPLAVAAAQAVELGWRRRAQFLGEAALTWLPEGCASATLDGSALEAAATCPAPEDFALAEPLLSDLDAGTFLFTLAVRARLEAPGPLQETTDRALSNLVLAGALEGEARREAAARP